MTDCVRRRRERKKEKGRESKRQAVREREREKRWTIVSTGVEVSHR